MAGGDFPADPGEGLQRTLGLRHRAALGLSDETDAAVVVLSEETGIISLAYQRRTAPSAHHRRTALPARSPSCSKQTMKNPLLNNWQAKLVSFLIALVIWAYVKNLVDPGFHRSAHDRHVYAGTIIAGRAGCAKL